MLVRIHVIFTNPTEIPSIDGRVDPTESEKKTYYSFINLKVIDTANYSYKFKLFFPDEELDTYRYITDVSPDNIDSIVDDYDTDLTLPLQVRSPFRFTESPKDPGGTEDAIFEVAFVGQVVQLKVTTVMVSEMKLGTLGLLKLLIQVRGLERMRFIEKL